MAKAPHTKTFLPEAISGLPGGVGGDIYLPALLYIFAHVACHFFDVCLYTFNLAHVEGDWSLVVHDTLGRSAPIDCIIWDFGVFMY